MLGVLEVIKQLHYPKTEAEYSAITEVRCKIILILLVLLFTRVVIEYTIIVHVDNIGAVFLSENTS